MKLTLLAKPQIFYAIATVTALVGIASSSLVQAQSQVASDQKAALQAVAKMMEGQRTYYQKNGQFRATVDNIQKDFGITLPATFDYAVRTTPEAAYSYVIPAQSALKS